MKKNNKKSQLIKVAAILATTSAGICFSGCATVAVAGAAGTVAYMRGDLTASFDKNVETVSAAINAAAQELSLNEIAVSSDVTAAEHSYRNAQDKKIVIKATSKGDNVTEVSVRVGNVGDKDLSNVIMDKIKKNLS